MDRIFGFFFIVLFLFLGPAAKRVWRLAWSGFYCGSFAEVFGVEHRRIVDERLLLLESC